MECPICGGPEVSSGERFSAFSQRSFAFSRCHECGFGRVVNPREDFGAIYDEQYFAGRGADPGVDYAGQFLGDPKSLLARIKEVEFEGLLSTLDRILEHRNEGPVAGKRILDFGGGLGGFVKYLTEQSIDAELYDEGYAIDFAEDHQVRVRRDLESVRDSYDVVFAVEMLEHVKDPDAVIELIRRVLKPGGLLIFTTGNLASHRGNISTWFYSKHPEVHISFWTPEAFRRICNRQGLMPIAIRFDPRTLQYRVLMRLPVFKGLAYATRRLWGPLVWIVDRRLGYSELGAAIRVA